MARNDDDDPVDQLRLDAEWLALNAVREAVSVGNRSTGGRDESYPDSLDLAMQIAPRLFAAEKSLLIAMHEPVLVREYRELAQAESVLQHRKVSPIDLLDREIDRLQRLSTARRSRTLGIRLAKLRRTREAFEERPFSEHKLISRDVLSAKRPDLPSTPIPLTDYIDHPLPLDQALRIRLLHPDKPEHATGADLLYEFCDQPTRQARITFVQYKIWDGRTLRFSSSKNLQAQLQKLQSLTCHNNLCSFAGRVAVPGAYRLPHCSAFLRPTDRLQSPDATMISRAFTFPRA